MSSNPCRRSTRHQHPERLMFPNETKINKTDCDNYLCFERDAIMEDSENIKQNNEKPTELFSNNDIDGKDMYPVNRTPTKNSGMIHKAKLCRSMQQDLSNIGAKDLRVQLTNIHSDTQTECNVKNNTNSNKNNAKCELLRGNESSPAGETDESFCNNRSSGSSDPEIADHHNIEYNKVNKCVLEKKVLLPLHPTLRRGKSRAAKDFHLKTDEYFATQSEKSRTSNNTLGKLKNRYLDEELAKSNHISKAHQKRIQEMSKDLQDCYTTWLHIMKEGFTVLLYGLGSKRILINNFHKQKLSNEPTLIINGFFPSLTLKEILDNIIIELLGLETVTNQSECYDIIEKTMKSYPYDHLYLLIHNIDGGMLRANKAQDMLSRLASMPNIHVLASVDHINAPLIWDNVKRARYNFYWMNATTFLPYEAETSYESSLFVQKSGALALLSLQNVFASLTTNAKSIYILLVKYQLTNSGNNYAGMAFKDLYRASREAFLVSSDQALRSQLTEFIDHKLVKTKRNVDGVEYLSISLDNALLKQFIEQQDEAL